VGSKYDVFFIDDLLVICGNQRRRSCGGDDESSKRQSISLDQTVAIPVNLEDLSEDQAVIM
jgi:hypothetical protein